jgi:hypothetical protein
MHQAYTRRSLSTLLARLFIDNRQHVSRNAKFMPVPAVHLSSVPQHTMPSSQQLDSR